ncbi:carbonic anhydrase-related protein-like isoform X1 [Cotesia glomerata]|uniref:carbonic anhydrase-related protein-like isoform X1 n=1 Tax=Cotesia glomerata TaxID=32391 RepID=UPI001D00D844|nr:carbonic anhydrase-related protein-like isoform X1 [Cotesia glomerata]
MIFSIFNFVLISRSVLLISAGNYSYRNADDWKNEFPECGGSEQSPLDVGENYDIEDKLSNSINEIYFENYDTLPERMILKNDGHTLKVIYEWAGGEEKIPKVHGNALDSYFILHSIQFRWGSNLKSGSEHHLRDKSFPMEVQLVHIDFEFDSIEDALEYERGIMIHSSFFKIGSEEHEFLTKITEKIPEVIEPGTETEIEPFSVRILYQSSDAKNFLIYHGSLTHPPCTESVIWMISDKIFPATEEQLHLFHTLKLLNDDDHNNRPLQQRNNRRTRLTVQGSD